MACKIRYTEHAAQDLDDIIAYTVGTLSSPQAAKDLLRELGDVSDNIKRFPCAAPVVINPYLQRTDIRKVPVKNYLLYYIADLTEEIITVLRIVYAKCDMDEVLKEIEP